jgi:hypothetical protein
MQHVSVLNVHINPLGICLKCRFWAGCGGTSINPSTQKAEAGKSWQHPVSETAGAQ